MKICSSITRTLVPELQPAWLLANGKCTRVQAMTDANPSAYTDEDRYQIGKCFYETGDMTRSAHIMNRLLARPSLSVDVQSKVLYALATIHAQSGHLTEALKNYERVLEVRPDDFDALCHHALVEHRIRMEGMPVFSGHALNPVMRYILDNREASHRALRCVAAYAREIPDLPGAKELAELSCRQMLLIPGREELAWSCMADNIGKWYHLDRVRVQAELLWLELAHEKWLAHAVQQDPQDPQQLTMFGNYLSKTGQPARAADVFETAAMFAVEADDLAISLQKAASSYFLAGDADLANRAWMLLRSIPGYEDQYVTGQALVAIAQHRFDDAMTILENAQRAPGPLHRLASGARIARFLSTREYSRVVRASAQSFSQVLIWCEDHLKLYPDDDTILHTAEYVNWRVREAAGEPAQIVTGRTDRIIDIGRQWDSRLSAVYLIYGALAYLHRGKLYQMRKGMTGQASADFDYAENILMEVMARKQGELTSGDELRVYNLMEAWLSWGWAKYNRGEFSEADRIFSAVISAQEWTAKEFESGSPDLYDWPRQKILPKQLVEAYRGVCTSRDQLARGYFINKDYEKASAKATEAVKTMEEGLAIERLYLNQPPARFAHTLHMGIVDGDPEVLRREQRDIVADGYVTYIRYFDPALHTEATFNQAVAQYWHAKILREWGRADQAAAEYEDAEKKFLEVRQQSPDHAETSRWLEYISVYYRRDMDKAETYFDEAMRLGTAEPADAIRKMVEGYGIQLEMNEDLSSRRLAQRGVMQIRHLLYTVRLADRVSDPRYVQRALDLAREVAALPVCEDAAAYRDSFRQLAGELEKNPGHRTQYHRQILEILAPCLADAQITPLPGVSRAPAGR